MRFAAGVLVSAAAALALPGALGCKAPSQDKGGESKGGPAPAPSRSPRLALNDAAVNKEITVPKIAPGRAPIINGNLSDGAWAMAASTGAFVDVGSGRERADLWPKGAALLMWDDAFLYVGFTVQDKTIRGGFPSDAKDPHLWERDTVEIMIDPDGDGDNKDYYEVQVNPQNLVFDTQYDGYNFPNGGGKGPFGHEEWSAGLESAVALDGTIDDDSDVDQGYTVELKIPWASLAKAKKSPPAPGDVWRMNFYAMQNNGGSAWSPILGQGNFHRASRFGWVKWGPVDDKPMGTPP